jgi:replication factor A1
MGDAANAISVGALRRITEGETVENPVLQCVQIKPMAKGQGGQERWRIVFNDTVNFIQGMMSMREEPAVHPT